MTIGRLPVLALATTLVLAACGGSDGDEASAAAGSTDGTEAPAPTDPPVTEPPVTEPPATTPETTTPETTAPETTSPETTAPPATPEPEPWTPVGSGPYDVGVATIVLDDAQRPLTVDVWFPLASDVDATALAPQRYTLLPDVYYESPDAVAASIDQISDDGPLPLIVYSHGSGGLRYIHSSYTEALASHGYLVAAPDHTGNTAVDRLAGSDADVDEISLARPTDVDRVIDAFLDPGHPAAGPFATTVDADQVVVTGHSFGGFTAIAAVTGFANDLGEIAADDRVDAIVPLAPAVSSTRLPDDLLATIDVPMMVIVGTDDMTTPVDPNVTTLWDSTTMSPAYRVEMVAAEHQTFTDICAYQVALPTLPNVPAIVSDTIDAYAVEGCSDGDMAADRAAELTNSYVLRFLDQVLRDGPAIDPTVVATPDDVIFDAR